MALNVLRVYLIIPCFFALLSITDTSKLNLPRILLPLFNSFSINFTLEVTENGCYKWTTSRLDVIQLIAVEPDTHSGCSSRVLISAITKEATRNTVIVLAEEVSSGQVLRCDVIVDVIRSLDIVTTTRELFMEEAPELFEVRAYDEQGNEFTSLEGVEFHWSVGSWGTQQVDHHVANVLRFITFRDSPYETPPTIAHFDTTNRRGHIVLIEGVKTGSAKVSVQLPYPEYKNVPPIEVQLMVVANLIIDPPDAYILRGDTLKYRLLQVHDGKLQEIRLPSAQYQVECEDGSVAAMDSKLGVALGRQLGRTKVVLVDQNVDAGGARLPTATLTVASPAYLTLALLPHRNWAVVLHQPATVLVEVFDSENHRFHVGDSVHVVITVPPEYFRVRSASGNGTMLAGWPAKPGTAQVTAVLESVRVPGEGVVPVQPQISTQADMLIYPPLGIVPSEVVLPWGLLLASKYEVKLNASGGDGSYLWSSSNLAVGSVSQSGVIRIMNRGHMEVSVAMKRNNHNRAVANIHVLAPRHLDIVEYVLEQEIGQPIFLYLAMYAERQVDGGRSKKIPFTQCQNLPFEVRVAEKSFYYNSSATAPLVGVSCGVVAIVGREVGTTKVTVSYRQGESSSLEASVSVAAFTRLGALHPSEGQTVLAVGSARQLVFTGGPRPWVGRHSHSVILDSTIVRVTDLVERSELYVFEVLCLRVGETMLQLMVGNVPVLGNCRHAESSATVRIICAKPRYISLRVDDTSPKCPATNLEHAVMQTNHPIRLLVTVKDDQGHVFDNATSLSVKWKLDPSVLLTVQYEKGIALQERVEAKYVLPDGHYQLVVPKNKTGVVSVVARVVDYRREVMRSLHLTPEWPVFGVVNKDGYEVTPQIEAMLSLELVNETVVTPNRTSIFNHPSNKALLKVTQGSGFYDFLLSTKEVASFQYSETSRQIEIVPMKDGILKLSLIDLCLPSKPTVIEIQVVCVGSVHLEVLRNVQKGECLTATVTLLDSGDSHLSVPSADLLDLRPIVDDLTIIDVTPHRLGVDYFEQRMRGELIYIVSGLQLGETNLAFVAGRKPNEVQSAPVRIQVFPPLRLLPRNLTLMVGSSLQLYVTGGPQPDSSLEFEASDANIAKVVTDTGLVTGQRFGRITVTGYIVGHKASGDRVVYSRDTVEVNVVPLDGIRVHAPLGRVVVGARLPVWATGIPDQLTPLVLGSVRPSLTYSWTLSAPEVVHLKDVLFETGLQVSNEERVSMRLVAVKPGRTRLSLTVSARGALTQCADKLWVLYNDSVELEVFEELLLTRPVHLPDTTLLVAPDTQMQLRTNKDLLGSVKYSVLSYPSYESGMAGRSQASSTALSKQSPVVSVDSSGLVSTHSLPGRALVLACSEEEHNLHQAAGISLEVKPVHYLMVNVETKLHVGADRQLRSLPRGLKLLLSVSYHDNYGAVFTATRHALHIRANRHDLAHVTRGETNGTMLAHLAQNGRTMLKVSDERTPHHSADYIQLTVDHLIYPQATSLIVGDIVCLSMPLVDAAGHSGIWSSEDPDVIVMERPDGIARAKNRGGSALIQYHLTNSITASTLLTVQPVQSVMFVSLGGRNLTNAGPAFLVELVLIGEGLTDRLNNLVALDNRCEHGRSYVVRQFPFTCDARFNMATLDINTVFTILPHFSIDTGFYSCQFEPIVPALTNVTTLVSDVVLKATVMGRGEGENAIVSDPIRITFYPAVHIHPSELHLSDKQTSAVLTFTATAAVLRRIMVVSMKESMLGIGPVNMISSNTATCTVSLKHYVMNQVTSAKTELNILVTSPLTQQEVSVLVLIHLERGGNWLSAPCLAGQGVSWLGAFSNAAFDNRAILIMLVSLLVVIFSLLYGIFWTFGQRTNHKIFANQLSPIPALLHGSPRAAALLNQSLGNTTDPRVGGLRRSPAFSELEPVYGDPRFPDVTLRSRSRRLQ